MFFAPSQLRTRLGRLKLNLLSALWYLRNYKALSEYFRSFDIENVRAYKLQTWHFGNRYFTADYCGPSGQESVFIKTNVLTVLIAREVRAIEKLQTSTTGKDHYPRLIAHSYTDSPYPFVALKFLQAGQLEPSAPYTQDEKRALMHQLVTILEALHETRLIHRDILPRNLLLEKSPGSVRLILIDFAFTLKLDAPLEDFSDDEDTRSLVKGLGKDLKPGPFAWDDAYSICKIMTLIDKNCAETSPELWTRAQSLVGKLTYTMDAPAPTLKTSAGEQ